MEFKKLNQINQLNEIDLQSHSKLQAIFKHSTQCSVSRMAKHILSEELESNKDELIDIYYLDLISYREISNEIASRYFVQHESPQILFIKDGKCIYHASHSDVSIEKSLREIAR